MLDALSRRHEERQSVAVRLRDSACDHDDDRADS
jgi:hypothetical protein